MKSALLALLLVSVVEAQEAGSDGQSLAQAASDPTASLMNVQLSDWYTANYWNLPDESANQFVIRTAADRQSSTGWWLGCRFLGNECYLQLGHQ